MSTAKKEAIRTTYFSIVSSFSLALIKGIAGVLGNSYALIADAIESTADVFASILVLFGIKYAHKPADYDHPYGHGKAEALVTFVVVGILLFSAGFIAYQSIENITTPHEGPKAWTLLVLLGIIVWKEYSFQVVMKKAKKINSSALAADAWHHRSDAITSVTAFVGITIALTMGPGYESADDWAALFAALFIIYNSYKIFKPALNEVMDETSYPEIEEKIRAIAAQVPDILGTEKCIIRKSGIKYHVELHALVEENMTVRKSHDLGHVLKDTLNKKIPELGYIIIHIEPNNCTNC
ncbi:cation diffusion facilitator family transporter [Flavobacterium agricola]|uniref:Cation diffusion facilitator family transporter n=1 Tax=Flavobacterium agricola TaxID=2870839 RepID=A0ABY6LZ39_9FLAO|nr:cation diffusion facilitator family transporter [Flavobacterium agricola]UYW00705.1 cation diffusion facilitator family transporter [Flavobacterium agricola]